MTEQERDQLADRFMRNENWSRALSKMIVWTKCVLIILVVLAICGRIFLYPDMTRWGVYLDFCVAGNATLLCIEFLLVLSLMRCSDRIKDRLGLGWWIHYLESTDQEDP